MKTLVGLYKDVATANQVVQEMVDYGIGRDGISLVVGSHTRGYAVDEDSDSGNRPEISDTGTTTAGGAAGGAVTGAVIGGVGGILLSLSALAIPGIGPIVAAGPLVAGLLGASAGVAVGGLLGALTEVGIPEEEAGYYVEGVQRGGTLISVQTDDNQVNDVITIMNQHDPIDVHERIETWRREVEPVNPDLTGSYNDVHVDDAPIDDGDAALSPEQIRANIQRIAEQPGAVSRTDYDQDEKDSYYTDGSQDERERKSLEERSPLNTRTNVGEQPGEYNEELRPVSRNSTEDS